MTEPRKPHFSDTQLTMLARCPKQYEFRYIEGIKAPPGVAQLIGTATHKSIAMNLIEKRDKGALLPEAAVSEIAVESLKNEWSGQEPVLQEDEKEAGVEKTKGEAIDTAAKLSLLHHHDLAPKIEPVHVERLFRLELKNFPRDLIGYIDIQEPKTIRDVKTSSKSPAADEADKSLQLTLYGLAAKVVDGVAPSSYALDYLVKKKAPEAKTLTTERTDEDFKNLLRRVEVASKLVESGIFYPTDPSNWWCSARWCGYYDRCEFGARKKVTVGFTV